MRCDICNNRGIVNGTYCMCGQGISLAIQNGDYQGDSEYEKTLANSYNQYKNLYYEIGAFS